MSRPLTLPESLCAFIRSLPTPPSVTQPDRHDAWPPSDNTDADMTEAITPAISPEWRAARDAYIGHIMTCHQCVTKGLRHPRHCPDGETLRHIMDNTP
ncbi:hypothetical protein FIG89_02615 [Salmonella enterica subsp. enterica]|nr:hypothetical protein [Salmonella enterica subsp. enterica serovar Potsdam]